MQTLQDFLHFYNEVYLIAYSELVGYLGDKPAQVLIEIENMSTHLVRYLDENGQDEARNKNLEKAYNHLVRVTIDCYKILWLQIKEDLLELTEIAEALKSDGVSAGEFFHLKQQFKVLSKEARKLEMDNVGTSPLACLDAYSKVIYFGWEIIGKHKIELVNQTKTIDSATGDVPPSWYRSPFGKSDDIDEGIKELN